MNRALPPGCQQMSGNVAELTPKQEEAILALLSNRTVEDAARAAKITPRTLYRYLKDPEFNAAYRQARWTAFGQCTARLQQASSAAVSVLVKVLADPTTPAAVKVRAADSVLDHAVKALEVEDIAARLAELERAASSARGSRKRSGVVEWASTKTLPGPAATPAQISPMPRLLAAPREAEMNPDTDQSQAPERVARMSEGELEPQLISLEAQKAKPQGPDGG
jgi:AcrR family transcriptional regulator